MIQPNGTLVIRCRDLMRGRIIGHWFDDGNVRYSVAWDDGSLTLGASRALFRLDRRE